jgi:hypothetical protein
MSLQHLFDAELRYRPDMTPIVTTGEGQLIGSGDGTLRGPSLRGTIKWTLFEQPGELVCGMNPVVALETDDGATVRIEGRGYGRRERADDQRWRVAATLRLDTPDERYAWLDGALGVWEGEFDAEQHRARYRAYASLGAAPQEIRTPPVPGSFTSADDWRQRRGRLAAKERSLYREILLAFARGEPPTRHALAALAGQLGVDLAAALARFEALDLVLAETDEVVVAYPFSGRPTAHRLKLPGGREAYAMCAVDALGVAAMLGMPVVVESRDPISGEEIVVDVSAEGEARWAPEEAVVLLGGRDGEQSISDLCCPVVNFFASPETANQYLTAHGDLGGAVVGIPAAVARGQEIFGEALT